MDNPDFNHTAYAELLQARQIICSVSECCVALFAILGPAALTLSLYLFSRVSEILFADLPGLEPGPPDRQSGILDHWDYRSNYVLQV